MSVELNKTNLTTETIPSEYQEMAEPMMLHVTSSPHIFSAESVDKIMWTVIFCALPAAIFGVFHFGLAALVTIILSVASAMFFEAIVLKLRNRRITLSDGSAVLTGLLLAMCLPPEVPFFIPIIGSFIAIVVAKHAMGGLGHNIFNPAHIGRAALVVSWPVLMTKWTTMQTVDGVSSATPLNVLKNQGYDQVVAMFGSHTKMYEDLFLGFRNGSLGETSIVLLLLGGAYLIYKGYIDWVVPVCMIGTVALLTWVFGPTGYFTGDPLLHVMTGGLVIGAFFMATDMVTTPITRKGQIIFAVGAGLIVVLIRLIGGYPEGVCYSILLMNSVTPLIDRLIKPAPFGRRVQRAKRA